MKSSINLALDPGFGIKLKWNDEQRKTKAEDRAFCPWQLSTSAPSLDEWKLHSKHEVENCSQRKDRATFAPTVANIGGHCHIMTHNYTQLGLHYLWLT